jgi:hypothetical protein
MTDRPCNGEKSNGMIHLILHTDFKGVEEIRREFIAEGMGTKGACGNSNEGRETTQDKKEAVHYQEE